MAAWVDYTNNVDSLSKTGNVATDAWKVALASVVNIADTTFVVGTTDLATGGGYTAGGNTASTTSSTSAAGVMKLVLASPTVWTATGGGFTYRYAILYNSTLNIPYGYWDYGASQAVAAGEQVQVNLNATTGVFTVTNV